MKGGRREGGRRVERKQGILLHVDERETANKRLNCRSFISAFPFPSSYKHRYRLRALPTIGNISRPRQPNQSRILAGTNLRTVISRIEYCSKHAGEANSERGTREHAGMLTYESTRVLHTHNLTLNSHQMKYLDVPFEPAS